MDCYKATFKCRHCRQSFYVAKTLDKRAARNVIIEIVSEKKNPFKISDKMFHTCDDGSLGYADFIGFECVKEEQDAE
jgi:hypothetical protein